MISNKQTTTTAEQRKKGLQKEKEKDSHHLDMADNSTHVPQEAKTQVYVLWGTIVCFSHYCIPSIPVASQ